MPQWIECPKCGVLYQGEHTCQKDRSKGRGEVKPSSSYMLVAPLTRMKEILRGRDFEDFLKEGMEVLVDIGKFYEMAGIIGLEALFNNVAIALLSAYKGDWTTAETFIQKAIEHAERGVEAP